MFFLNPEPVILHVPGEPLYFIDVHGQSLGNTTAVHRLHSRNKEKNKWGIDLLKFAFMQRFHRGRTVCRVKPRPRGQPHFFLPIPPLQNDPPFIAFFFPFFPGSNNDSSWLKWMFQEGRKQRQGIPCSSTDSLSEIDFRFCRWTIDLRSYDGICRCTSSGGGGVRCGALWGGEIPDDQLNCREKLHMQPSLATLCCARLVKM
jgi:hypothetical protein